VPCSYGRLDGCHGIIRYQPTADKIMRLHAQTRLIENGFVYLRETASWLAADAVEPGGVSQ
jgi:phage terminase large subunit-like protein